MSLHLLDRPIWHALATRQSTFALGNDLALRLVPDVGVFAAARDDSPESQEALADLVSADGRVALLQAGDSPLPPGTAAEKVAPGVQMLAGTDPIPIEALAIRLTEADAPDMLALATLTEPGPFFSRTHHLGQFWGIKENGRLAAMAGERMKPPGFTEVSGVCTHPDFRGRGYARLLSAVVMNQIIARGETPFLHAYAANTAAIELYRSLGFALRSLVTLTLLRRG